MARSLLEYARELIDWGRTDIVDLPVRSDDGSIVTAQVLVGTTIGIHSVPDPRSFGLSGVDAAPYLRGAQKIDELRLRLRAPSRSTYSDAQESWREFAEYF